MRIKKTDTLSFRRIRLRYVSLDSIIPVNGGSRDKTTEVARIYGQAVNSPRARLRKWFDRLWSEILLSSEMRREDVQQLTVFTDCPTSDFRALFRKIALNILIA